MNLDQLTLSDRTRIALASYQQALPLSEATALEIYQTGFEDSFQIFHIRTWQPISEAKPNIGEKVLVVTSEIQNGLAIFTKDETFQTVGDDATTIKNVTFWQSFPEPPNYDLIAKEKFLQDLQRITPEDSLTVTYTSALHIKFVKDAIKTHCEQIGCDTIEKPGNNSTTFEFYLN